MGKELSTAPASVVNAITPSADELSPKPRGFMVSVAGNVEIVDSEGTTTILTDLATGVVYPISPTKILATNTTATGIVGIL